MLLIDGIVLVVDTLRGNRIVYACDCQRVTAMPDRNRPERLQIMLNADELKVVDDWRFSRRMPSRASAIRELLKRGLAVEGIDLETIGKHSASFGILSEEATGDAAD